MNSWKSITFSLFILSYFQKATNTKITFKFTEVKLHLGNIDNIIFFYKDKIREKQNNIHYKIYSTNEFRGSQELYYINPFSLNIFSRASLTIFDLAPLPPFRAR